MVTSQDLQDLLAMNCNDKELKRFETTHELDSAVMLSGLRFRANFFKTIKGSAVVLRRVESVVPEMEQLNLPPVLYDAVDMHKGLVLVTGPTGSGKSTIANALDDELNKLGMKTYILDGDNVRMGLNKDLSFSPEDRKENIRRISEVAKLFADSGKVVMTAFISPYKDDRDEARKLIGEDFIEIFINTPIDECIQRDPKGLYHKALNGEIKGFTGIDAPYEEPQNPEIEIKNMNIDESVNFIINSLKI